MWAAAIVFRGTRRPKGVDRASAFVITSVSSFGEGGCPMKICMNDRCIDYLNYINLIAQTFTAEIRGAFSLGRADLFGSDSHAHG